jgi:hypothetical protein
VKKPELINLLTQAKLAPAGIKVSTNNPKKLRDKLYATKRNMPEFENISMAIPATSPHDTLFIISKPEPSDASDT